MAKPRKGVVPPQLKPFVKGKKDADGDRDKSKKAKK